MTKKALKVLEAVFGENSNVQLPVGVASEVIEIRKWVAKELETNGTGLQQ